MHFTNISSFASEMYSVACFIITIYLFRWLKFKVKEHAAEQVFKHFSWT